MSLNFVTLTGDLGTTAASGTATFTASNWLTDSTDELLIPPEPSTITLPSAGTFSTMLLATDNAAPLPAGWSWQASFQLPGINANTFSFFLPAGPYGFTATHGTPAVFTNASTAVSLVNGTGLQLSGASLPGGFGTATTYYVVASASDTFELAATSGGTAITSTSTGSGSALTVSTDISFVAPLGSVPSLAAYLPLAGGTMTGPLTLDGTPPLTIPLGATSGYVWTSNSSGQGSWQAGGGGGSGSVASVFGRTGAVTAQSGDYGVAQVTGAAPLASPALTGTPTAPTQTPLTSNTDIATTAYTDAAVAVEKTRAEAAEVLLLPLTGGTLSGGLTVEGALLTPPSVLTDGATIAVNAALSDFFRVTLGGNRTLANPTNPVDGQAIVFEIIQDGTGSRTLAYGGQYSFPTSIGTPVLSTSPGFHDFLAFRYDSGTTTWYCAGFVPQSSPSSPLAIGSGGTGQSTASAAFNALSPMTTLGDLIYGGASGAGTRLGGNATTQAEYLQSTGNGSAATAPTWSTVSGQYLCAPSQYAPSPQVLLAVGSPTLGTFGESTTVASGSSGGEISTIGSWASPSGGVLDVASTNGFTATGTLSVGASGPTVAQVTYTGTAATSFTGCAYVSGSPTGTVSTAGIVAQAGAPSLISTGTFTAPASGSVVVTANVVGYLSAAATGVFGLAAHGTTTPILAGEFVFNDSATTIARILNPVFVVGSLTAGSAYTFDLLGAATTGDFFLIAAQNATGTTPTLSSRGGPATMLVQAV